MKTTSRLAVAAAAGIFMGGFALTPVNAADLGGDCCADLEERVAELEATTVRKGNTRVSLKLRGQITKALLYWDDQVNDDIYVGDNDASGSRFILQGNAQVNSNLEIGFYAEYDIQTNPLNDLDQTDANVKGSDVIDASDVWFYVKGPWGRLSIGRNDDANQGIAEIDLSGTGIVADASPDDNISSFFVVGLGGTRWGEVVRFSPGDGGESENVKYDSPTFAGFTISASWQAGADAVDEEEGWEVALRFAQEFGGTVRVAAGVGYGQEGETIDDDDHWAVSGSMLHVPTGLNVSGSYSNRENDDTGREDDAWYVKVGLLQTWTPMGKTGIYGEYGQYERDDFLGFGGSPSSDEVDYWGFGIVQNVDAAATEFYIGYKHYELDSTTTIDGVAVPTTLDGAEFDAVLAGARIKF